MIIYLTYNDAPSGIYSSQVIDVVKFIRTELDATIRLVAFISIRGFSKNKTKIKKELPDAIVLPMFPGVHRWRFNIFLLRFVCFFLNPNKIIGRSVLATQLAIKCRKGNRKIIYDGRGAIAAEWKEYGVITNSIMLEQISKLEKEVILNVDFRIAVSEALLKHWQSEYAYRNNQHVIIPCTLNEVFESNEINLDAINTARKLLGIGNDDLVCVYSGSIAGWQSFDLLYSFIVPLLQMSSTHKLLFLSDKDHNILKLEQEFPGQIKCKKVDSEQVPCYLVAGDYGLLIRENSVTNKVASPVKFAEYLACGLKVIISEELGDYSEFVNDFECGFNFKNTKNIVKLNLLEKQELQTLALQNFTKRVYKKSFSKLIEA